MKKHLTEHDLALRDEMRDIVSYILTSTKHHKDNPDKRTQVVNSMIRAMGMSQRRGGDVTDPKQTEIYRIAELFKEAANWNEFTQLCSGVTRKQPIDILTSYNLEWNPKFPLPDHIRPNRPKEKEKVIAPVSTEPEKNENNAISKALQDANTQIQEITKELALLKEFIKNHTHIDGKVKIVKYEDLD
jgi:hypothetical protein